jgi:hypothetical protein
MKTVTEHFTWKHYGEQVAGHLEEAVESRNGTVTCLRH